MTCCLATALSIIIRYKERKKESRKVAINYLVRHNNNNKRNVSKMSRRRKDPFWQNGLELKLKLFTYNMFQPFLFVFNCFCLKYVPLNFNLFRRFQSLFEFQILVIDNLASYFILIELKSLSHKREVTF